MHVFDRRSKLLQRERAAANKEVEKFDFLKEEVCVKIKVMAKKTAPLQVGYRVADRVLDVARRMEVAVDLGSGRGWVTRFSSINCVLFGVLVTRHLMSESVGRLTAIELSPTMLAEAPDPEGLTMDRLAMDLDGAELPFADNSVDLVTSCLAMHWINDLPGLFREVQRILKPDGVFIGEIANFDCLTGTNHSPSFRGNVWRGHPCWNAGLLAIGWAWEGGRVFPSCKVGNPLQEEFSYLIFSPFVEVRDLGGLLSSNGFSMLTIDTDDLKVYKRSLWLPCRGWIHPNIHVHCAFALISSQVRYSSLFPLFADLKGMAENSAAINRKLHLHRFSLFSIWQFQLVV